LNFRLTDTTSQAKDKRIKQPSARQMHQAPQSLAETGKKPYYRETNGVTNE